MLRKLVAILFIATALAASAQTAPKEPTVAELELQIAQKDVEIANLRIQLLDAQAMMQLFRSPQYQAESARLQQGLAAAQKHAQDAAPKSDAKK